MLRAETISYTPKIHAVNQGVILSLLLLLLNFGTTSLTISESILKSIATFLKCCFMFQYFFFSLFSPDCFAVQIKLHQLMGCEGKKKNPEFQAYTFLEEHLRLQY